MKRRLVVIAGITTVALIAGGAVFVTAQANQSRQSRIPQSLVGQAQFPLYRITKLPEGYRIVPESYKFSERVLIFSASNDTQTLAITQQQKPKDLDFDEFYQKQVTNRAKLPDMPFDTTIGTLPDGKTNILSITTDETWVLVSTKATLSASSWAQVARGIRLQK